MEIDTVAAPGMPGFDTLGMSPEDMGRTLDEIVAGSAGHHAW
jgi:hypothetical protein